MSEKDHYRFGLSKRGKNVYDNNTLADDLRDCIAALELDAELNKVRIAELEADLAGWLRWYWDHANGRSAKTRELLFKYTAPETPDPSTRTGPYTGDYDDLRGDRASETK